MKSYHAATVKGGLRERSPPSRRDGGLDSWVIAEASGHTPIGKNEQRRPSRDGWSTHVMNTWSRLSLLGRLQGQTLQEAVNGPGRQRGSGPLHR